MFEALACGIQLVTAPWEDAERLFRPGTDYLVAHDGREMKRCLRDVLETPDLAADLATRHQVPVIDGVAAAVKLAEALVTLRLTTSQSGPFARTLAA